MTPEKEFFNLLSERTENGKVNWEPTAQDAEFVAAIGKISVSIKSTPPRNPDDDEPDFILRVSDKDDREVFSVYNSESEIMYKELRSLHNRARRTAMQVDRVLQELIQDLKTRS